MSKPKRNKMIYGSLSIPLLCSITVAVLSFMQDMESDPVVMSYAKNGEDLGTCFSVEKEKLGEQALFPHLMTKNTEFECNFGARVSYTSPLSLRK